jgi:hypothetical protein
MKRTILSLTAVLALMVGGALTAQSFNGTAPQGTQQTDPGQTSNNVNTPRNTNPSAANSNGMSTGTNSASTYGQSTATGSTTGTTGSSVTQTQTQQPTDPTAAVPPSNPNATATDMTATPSSTGTGSTTTPTTTGAGTATDTTATDTTNTAATATATNQALPRTASDLPMIAVLGLLALGAGFMVRAGRSKA